MTRGLAAILVTLVVAAPPVSAAVRVVEPFPLERYAGTGAIGLAVPGAGPAVTRESALNTLLTGEVQSSLLGGTPPGRPLIELDRGAPPDTLVVLPPAGKSGNARYPIAVTPGPRGVLTSDSTRIAGLVSLADVAHGRLEVVEVDDPVATLERLDRRIAWNDDWRLLLSVLAGGIAYLAAVFVPRFGPRVVLLALAANLWLAGWWVVALLGVAAALLPLGVACATVLAAYLLALGLDPEAVALSPFGPSQAGRFYGVSNLLETMLLVPALLGPWLLGRVGIAVGALAVVTVRATASARTAAGSSCCSRGTRRWSRTPTVRDFVPSMSHSRRRASSRSAWRSSGSMPRSAAPATSPRRSATARPPFSETSPTGSRSPFEGASPASGRRSPSWRRSRCSSWWRPVVRDCP